MDVNKIKKEIRSFLIENFTIDEKLLDDNSNIFDELGIDSLGMILIITFLEKTYKIEITQKEILLDNFESIDSLSNFIEKKISGKLS